MPSAWPAPCRIEDTGTGDFYYFDGVNPPTIMTGGVGTDLNSVLGSVGSYQATTTQRQNIQNYFLGRLQAFAAIAACETCPELAAKADPGNPHADEQFEAHEVRAAVLSYLGADGDAET